MKVCSIMKTMFTLVGISLTAISSAHAGNACAVLYGHANYRGSSYSVWEGQSQSYIGDGWNDSVSSVQVVPGCALTLFEHANYGGASLTLTGNVPKVGSLFNDETSSFWCYCE